MDKQGRDMVAGRISQAQESERHASRDGRILVGADVDALVPSDLQAAGIGRAVSVGTGVTLPCGVCVLFRSDGGFAGGGAPSIQTIKEAAKRVSPHGVCGQAAKDRDRLRRSAGSALSLAWAACDVARTMARAQDEPDFFARLHAAESHLAAVMDAVEGSGILDTWDKPYMEDHDNARGCRDGIRTEVHPEGHEALAGESTDGLDAAPGGTQADA